jgi:hypothetical protein
MRKTYRAENSGKAAENETLIFPLHFAPYAVNRLRVIVLIWDRLTLGTKFGKRQSNSMRFVTFSRTANPISPLGDRVIKRKPRPSGSTTILQTIQ